MKRFDICPDQTIDEALARCDREIAAMYAREDGSPAWLTTLGITDWEAEKRILQEMIHEAHGGPAHA
jgi:hypothetical protein